jgi:hypothetical protein
MQIIEKRGSSEDLAKIDLHIFNRNMRALEKFKIWLRGAQTWSVTMTIPPSVKTVLPSLQISQADKTARVKLSDLKKHLPSLQLFVDGRAAADAEVKVSLSDLRQVLHVALSGVQVDEAWYLAQDPALSRDVQSGKFRSATEHYIAHGYLEGRLPSKPIVDERTYLQNNQDVAQAVRTGKFRSAFDHYVRSGYAEGRVPSAPPKRI